MKNSVYQIILLGGQHELCASVQAHLENAMVGVQLSKENFRFLRSEDFDELSLGINPTIALYFATRDFNREISIIKALEAKSVIIIPIVDSFDNAKWLPSCLSEINAKCISGKEDGQGMAELANLVLSDLGLLTNDRNVFISYKRLDCKELANQLYDNFLQAGYTVFLDTESLSAGVNFQKSLRHRLTDSFVLVLLYSQHFFDKESKWTMEEYKLAQELKLGICSILMPGVDVNRNLSFTDVIHLDREDFMGNILNKAKASDVVLHITSIYARLFQSRKLSLVNAFTENLKKQKVIFFQDVDGTISILSPKLRCKVIPLIGVPKSWDYYMSDIKQQKEQGKLVFLLYNNQCILDTWLDHLAWLEKKTNIHTINVNDNLSWIQENL